MLKILSWTAKPTQVFPHVAAGEGLENRKRSGFRVMSLLSLFLSFFQKGRFSERLYIATYFCEQPPLSAINPRVF